MVIAMVRSAALSAAVGLVLWAAPGCNLSAPPDDPNPPAQNLPGDGDPADTCVTGAACDDQDPCTENDACADDTCTGTPIPGCVTCASDDDCPDTNPCVSSTCGPAGRCTGVHNDGIPCGDDGTCLGGACLEPVTQSDLDGNVSDAGTGAPVNLRLPVQLGAVLSVDAPDPTVRLAGPPVGCSCAWSIEPAGFGTFADPNACQTTLTVNELGGCLFAVEVTCASQTVRYEQTLTSSRTAQSCQDDADCDDGNACTISTCGADGACVTTNRTAFCDDGDPCTDNDTCTAGACAGSAIAGCGTCTTAADCADGNPCTIDTCVDSRCTFTNTAGSCDDGDACTTGDTCSAGACAGTQVTGCVACATDSDCATGNPCRAGACSAGACVFSDLDGQSCDDGDACTTGDVCSGGSCAGTGPAPTWHLVQSGLSAAVYAVQQVANGDVYFVGTDAGDGDGGFLVRYDGENWVRLLTGVNEDFYWVHEAAPDDIWVAGDHGTTLRKAPGTTTFIQIATPAVAQDRKLWGIWGASGSDVWTVGGQGFGNGVILRRQNGAAWTAVDVPGLPTLPVMYKVWGTAADDVSFAGGPLILQYDGDTIMEALNLGGMFVLLFTVGGNAAGGPVAAVGGNGFNSGNVYERTGSTWAAASGTGLSHLNGVHANAAGNAYAVGHPIGFGQAPQIARRTNGVWTPINHGLAGINDLEFHAVWVTDEDEVWAVGGDLIGFSGAKPDLGMIAYLGGCAPSGEIAVPSEELTAPSAAARQDDEPRLARVKQDRSAAAVVTGGPTLCDLAACLNGVDQPPLGDAGQQADCLLAFDQDIDGDIDLRDFAQLQGDATTDLGGLWLFEREITGTTNNTPPACAMPVALTDVTTSSFVQVGDDVTITFVFDEDTDGDDRIDASPGQLWFKRVFFFCDEMNPPTLPFVLTYHGTLVGNTLTAVTPDFPDTCTGNPDCPGEQVCLGFSCQFPYCFCGWRWDGALTATLCGNELTGEMTVNMQRECPQFGAGDCGTTYSFSAIRN